MSAPVPSSRTAQERKTPDAAPSLEGVIPVDRPLFIVGRSGSGKSRLVKRLITENHYGERACIHVVSRQSGYRDEYADVSDRIVSCAHGWDGFRDTVKAVHAAAEARLGQERAFRRRVLICDFEGTAREYFNPRSTDPEIPAVLARLLRRGHALGTVVVFTSQTLLGRESLHLGVNSLVPVKVDYPRSSAIEQIPGASSTHRV